MTTIPIILHVGDDAERGERFAQGFARSGLPATLHGVIGTSEALLFLNRIGPFARLSLPRLIVLDLVSATNDGRELLAVLKRNAFFRSIPLVVLTSSDDPAEVAEYREQGAQAVLIRPHADNEMVELIRALAVWIGDVAEGGIGSGFTPA